MANLSLVVGVFTVFYVSGCWGGGKLYVYPSVKVNWFEAYMYCNSFNARMLTIHNKEKSQQVLQAIQTCNQQCGVKMDHVWTSGTDLPSEGKFVWMGDGQPVTFTDWNPNEPNNMGQEDCVELWDASGQGHMGWNDRPCRDEYYVICEER